jgi:hypothetical protein
VKPTDKRNIEALLWALKPLANLRGSIPLPYATTFLMVALDEGKSINAYARAVGINRAAMHRYMQNIGDRARNGGAGLGLVRTEQHPTFSNRRQVLLTDKGRLLAEEIFQQMNRSERVRAEVGSPLRGRAKKPPNVAILDGERPPVSQ